MKKNNKKYSWVKRLALVALALTFLLFSKNDVQASQSSGFFEFDVVKEGTVETAVITKYNGISSAVKIPTKLNGFKVTAVGSYAFSGNLDLKKVTLPTSVTEIKDGAFRGCSNLNTINLQNIKTIGKEAFYGTALKSVNLSKVITIAKNAFQNCAALSTVNFGNHQVESIDEGAFYGTGLKTLTLNCKDFVTGDFYTHYHDRNGAFAYCKQLKSVNIKNPNGKIGFAMFYGCSALTSVKLDDTIIQLGAASFTGCTSLKSITLPSKLNKIMVYEPNGLYVFEGCTSLERIEIPAGVRSLNLTTFTGCTSLKEIKLNNGLLYINACDYNSQANDFTNVKMVIPNTVRSIDFGKLTFGDIIIPNSVRSIAGNRPTNLSYYSDSPLKNTLANYENATELSPIKEKTLKLNKTKLTLQAGDTFQLTAVFTPTNTTAAVTWESTNTSIATVDELGMIKANSKGQVVIRATSTNGKKAAMTLVVKQGPSTITFDTTDVTMGVGETLTRKATVDKAAYNKKITYESSDPSIATVNKNGKVKAVKTGTVTIKAVASNGISKAFNVTVMKAPKKITMKASSSKIKVKGRSYLTVKFPANTASHKITFTSSNKKIATVSADGVVTGKKAGTVKITAKTFNGKKVTKTIRVVKK